MSLLYYCSCETRFIFNDLLQTAFCLPWGMRPPLWKLLPPSRGVCGLANDKDVLLQTNVLCRQSNYLLGCAPLLSTLSCCCLKSQCDSWAWRTSWHLNKSSLPCRSLRNVWNIQSGKRRVLSLITARYHTGLVELVDKTKCI